jgi:hypothetical protein
MYGDESSCWQGWDDDLLPEHHGLVPRVTRELLVRSCGSRCVFSCSIRVALGCFVSIRVGWLDTAPPTLVLVLLVLLVCWCCWCWCWCWCWYC